MGLCVSSETHQALVAEHKRLLEQLEEVNDLLEVAQKKSTKGIRATVGTPEEDAGNLRDVLEDTRARIEVVVKKLQPFVQPKTSELLVVDQPSQTLGNSSVHLDRHGKKASSSRKHKFEDSSFIIRKDAEVGIGISVIGGHDANVPGLKGATMINKVEYDSPADLVNIHVGDRILAINDVPCEHSTHAEVVTMLASVSMKRVIVLKLRRPRKKLSSSSLEPFREESQAPSSFSTTASASISTSAASKGKLRNSSVADSLSGAPLILTSTSTV